MTHDPKMTALIVEDHSMVGEMLETRVSEAGFTTVANVTTAQGGLDAYKAYLPDLTLCDVRLGGNMDGIALTRRICSHPTPGKVVMVSSENAPEIVQAAYDAGAAGFVSKYASGPELLQAIADAMAGIPNVADRHTYRRIIASLRDTTALSATNLTPRELEIVRLIVGGTATTAALAQTLGIAPSTVRTLVDRVRRKLSAHSRAEIVARAYLLGIV